MRSRAAFFFNLCWVKKFFSLTDCFFWQLRFFLYLSWKFQFLIGNSPDHHFPTICGSLVLWGGQTCLVREMGTWRCCISDEQSKKIVLGECWCCSREKKKKRASMLSNLVFVAAAAAWAFGVFFFEARKNQLGKNFFFFLKKGKPQGCISVGKQKGAFKKWTRKKHGPPMRFHFSRRPVADKSFSGYPCGVVGKKLFSTGRKKSSRKCWELGMEPTRWLKLRTEKNNSQTNR